MTINYYYCYYYNQENNMLSGLPKWLSGKEYACNARDMVSIPGLGRCPGEGNATHSSILA